MKSLEQIKNDYAVTQGYKEWLDLVLCISTSNAIKSNYSKLTLIETHMDNICILAQKECLKSASENIDTSCFRSKSDYIFTVKEITNENNIIK